MKKVFYFIVMLLFNSNLIVAQVGINTDSSIPDPSAILDAKSTSKGFLPPRMTHAELNAIPGPADGLVVYCTDCGADGSGSLTMFMAGAWYSLSVSPMNPIFTCGQSFTDQRDNKVYATVLIESQCWMKQNLNIGTMINESLDQNNNSVIEKYCYNNLESNCDIYGGLYQWNELMNYTTSSNSNPSGRQGICPTGWHVPSDAEFCQMDTYLDTTLICTNQGWLGTDIGNKLKSATGWYDGGNGSNSSGFTALPAGYSASTDGFQNITIATLYLSSSATLSLDPYIRYLDYYHGMEIRASSGSNFGFSARCIKDN